MTIGPREQYTQQGEGLSDNFRLADLTAAYNFGPATLTSITSYTNRHVLVTRDATQLTGSVTFDVFREVPQVRINSPSLDHTKLNVISEELRISSNMAPTIEWLMRLQQTGGCQHVPTARSAGIEAELFARPNASWDFGLSATWADAKLTSSVISTLPDGTKTVVGGVADGNRLPTAPKFQVIGSVGFTKPLGSDRDFYSILTVQYVGSSFWQFENEGPNWGGIGTGLPNAARLIAYGAPPPGTMYRFDAELPSYSLDNIRAGVRTERWDAAAYINNLWDETARLALDYERGCSARVGYLTNQPRTFGYRSYKF